MNVFLKNKLWTSGIDHNEQEKILKFEAQNKCINFDASEVIFSLVSEK